MEKFICEVLEITTFKENRVKILAPDGKHTCKVLRDWDKVYDFLFGDMPITLHHVDKDGLWYITIGD